MTLSKYGMAEVWEVDQVSKGQEDVRMKRALMTDLSNHSSPPTVLPPTTKWHPPATSGALNSSWSIIQKTSLRKDYATEGPVTIMDLFNPDSPTLEDELKVYELLELDASGDVDVDHGINNMRSNVLESPVGDEVTVELAWDTQRQRNIRLPVDMPACFWWPDLRMILDTTASGHEEVPRLRTLMEAQVTVLKA
ncbi:hypothetical protein P691DRAFT_781010 [Macrolepiota fuliginosa MF-IS2]|uniref:Uncharacterized protein n=1 Tax=Macrolepiota fuliginosa MF-IS2 TaxID=1400762 RepID=A0A9P5WXP2_9AGAR|nr:hypothetical protein P691DRAFT_781010 [Macrolepiota fuliginosa MF-IS2]